MKIDDSMLAWDRVSGILLAAFALRGGTTDSCLNLETLAALAEGRLASGRRRLTLAHLANCNSCYREWSLLMEGLEGLEDVSLPLSIEERINAWWQQWRAQHPWTPVTLGSFGVAMAALLLVLMPHGGTQDPLRQGVDQLRGLGMEVHADQAWRWEGGETQWRGPYGASWSEQTRGGPTSPSNEVLRRAAFAAGVREVLIELKVNGTRWEQVKAVLPDWQLRPDTDTDVTALLDQARRAGSWSTLTHLACQVNPPPSFWSLLNSAWGALIPKTGIDDPLSLAEGLDLSSHCTRATQLLDRFLGMW